MEPAPLAMALPAALAVAATDELGASCAWARGDARQTEARTGAIRRSGKRFTLGILAADFRVVKAKVRVVLARVWSNEGGKPLIGRGHQLRLQSFSKRDLRPLPTDGAEN